MPLHRPSPLTRRTEAFANYTAAGGNIAFLSGVSGNLSYTVTNVLPNGSMDLIVAGNLSLGTEVDIPTSQVSENLTDSAYSPEIFPALPPGNLGSKHITFQNVSCVFETDSILSGTCRNVWSRRVSRDWR